jgi:thymidylate synthase
MVTELLWFLRGDTNIKFLVENGCHIWDGDAYKNYINKLIFNEKDCHVDDLINQPNKTFVPYSQEEFINKIKTDDEFANKWGELGPIYGKQWRSWTKKKMYLSTDGSYENIYDEADQTVIDQISILINDLKTNPDSRRMMVNAWNVGELDQMVLPPCHYGFQVYTRELSDEERLNWMKNNKSNVVLPMRDFNVEFSMDEWFRPYGVPKRAISLMFNMRSNDVPLGLPFNIASYALLLEIIGKIVNMVPDELMNKFLLVVD